jgi:hypothetical protein
MQVGSSGTLFVKPTPSLSTRHLGCDSPIKTFQEGLSQNVQYPTNSGDSSVIHCVIRFRWRRTILTKWMSSLPNR